MRPALLLWLLPVSALAQPPALPAPQPPPQSTCTDVQVGSARGYDCLNAQLGAIVRAAPRTSAEANAPVSATSPSNVVGTFNESGTRNRLGTNFGKSSQPARPVQGYAPALARPR